MCEQEWVDNASPGYLGRHFSIAYQPSSVIRSSFPWTLAMHFRKRIVFYVSRVTSGSEAKQALASSIKTRLHTSRPPGVVP
jgi:hypothetical protein